MRNIAESAAGSCLGCLIALGLLVGGFVALIVIIASNWPEPTPKTPQQIAAETKEQEELELQRQAAEVEAEKLRVTMDEYNQIQTDMTWDEVVAIVGQPNEELSRNKIADIETIMYQWENPGIFAGNMHIIFQNGRVMSKSQFGLK